MQILKYAFHIADTSAVTMPAGARILSVQYQESSGETCIWALVDPGAIDATRALRIFWTGGEVDVPVDTPFLGTVQLYGGATVLHVFDLGEAP